jgi:hypothetical protein
MGVQHEVRQLREYFAGSDFEVWNPLSIVVPCHRVIGASGTLTGYAGGVERKRFLLSLEEPPAEELGRLF